MSLPSLTAQERAAALEKAVAARTIRSDIKSGLKTGSVSVADVIGAASEEPALGRLKVTDLLEALPGIGKVRATLIMSELGIAPTRRVRGLGVHQRRALVEHLGQQQ
ncbi:integration host factor, actinobacterial type [Arthrobacter cryoconiti]|uniref:Integration host factor, actinobacterial type n=1 Tax=Arthrobacter cryoconiti TaxID=748907 RepID=A0ABV8QYT3_9MICC|nr:integration host factor, actinobacterial type [Arthrobacter cryoconiti]MCC9069472.1 DNA-binding protein [Arthrobacter cryoconiti]